MTCRRDDKVMARAWSVARGNPRSELLGLVAMGLGLVAHFWRDGGLPSRFSLLVFGVALFTFAVVLPSVSEAEIGLKGFHLKRFFDNRDAAFTTFVAAIQGSLTRFALLMTGDGKAAEDIVADALGTAYGDMNRVHHDDLRIHLLCTVVQLARGRQRLFALDLRPAIRKGPHGADLIRLEKLSVDDRAIALLADDQALDLSEVAEIMHLPRETVEQRLKTIHAQLDAERVPVKT